MALFDKVKEQAAQAAQKAQEAAQRGQEKIEETQAKRREDALLRDLGAAVYAERTGTGSSNSSAEIEQLITDITAQRSEHAGVAAATAADTSAPSSAASDAAEGDFKLD